MSPIAMIVLPFLMLPAATAALYRANGGWRAELGAALAGVTSWFALFWALIGSALFVASCETHLRSPRTFHAAVASLLLVLGYVWVIVRARRAKRSRTATLRGIFASCALLLFALGLAASLTARA